MYTLCQCDIFSIKIKQAAREMGLKAWKERYGISLVWYIWIEYAEFNWIDSACV